MKKIPVIIIGGGPVGLSMALALARQNVKSILIERNPTIMHHPRARGVSTRSMELFRQWGNGKELLTYELPKEARRFIWMESLQGKEITRVEKNYTGMESFSPSYSSYVSQDRVEQSLVHSLEKYSQADIQFSKELVDFTQNDHGVTVRILDRKTQQEEAIFAHYLIAADGANSNIRKQLNIEMHGNGDMGRYCNVYCEMDISTWTQHRLAINLLFANPALTGRFLASVDGKNRWLVGMRFFGDQTKEDFTDDYCLSEIHRITGLPELTINILSKNFWTMGAQMPNQYRKGSIFLVGDAAHRMPPTGGLGMNTGIQDAHNLAWKLAMVLNYGTSTTLLDTYYDERAPVAKHNMEWSCDNTKRLSEISMAIKKGNMDLLKTKLQEQHHHLNYAGLDLGFIYHSKAIISENDQMLSVTTSKYVPTTLPGSRVPHMELIKDGVKISILDLFEKEFVLLLGRNGQAWQIAAEKINEKNLSWPLKIYRVAADGDLHDDHNKWHEIYEVDYDGVVLVRPDGHVAWRSKNMVSAPLTTLQEVFKMFSFE